MTPEPRTVTDQNQQRIEPRSPASDRIRWPRFLHLKPWLFLGLFLYFIFLLSDSLVGREFMPVYLLVLAFLCGTLWLLAAPVIWELAGRFPISAPKRLHHGAVHFFAALLFSLTGTTLFAAMMWQVDRIWFQPPPSFLIAFRSAIFYFLLAKILFYGLIVAARIGFDLSGQLEREETRRVQTEKRLLRARLDVLRMQMNPHFLFNTLNTVSGLIRTEQGPTALGILSRLGDVLRSALEEDDLHFAPLEGEIQTLNRYLEIERCRFGDRLEFHTEIDPSVLEIPIPRWLLQPLVENAIIHGIESDPRAGKIQLRAGPDSSHLRISIENDGHSAPDSPVEGIGLGNTRKRVEALYGDRGRVEVESLPRGTRVTLWLPLEQTRPEVNP